MEQHALHLARAFAARGNRVTIGYVERLEDGDWLDAEAFRAVKVGAPNPLRRYLSVGAIARLAREAELVHCTGWDASAWGRLAAGIARRPVIVTEHSSAGRSTQRSLGTVPIGRVIAWHNRLLDPITSGVVAVAQSQVPSLVREGVRASKIVVIPNGVALESLRADAQRGVTRADLGIPADVPVVIQVGRFIPQKRQEWTYNAVKAARTQLGDVRLLLVGDGPERPALQRRADAEDAKWVQFLGHRADAARLLTLSDLAVLPSAAEALPMVVIEALALGIPQVATDVGDAGAVLGSSGAGIVVDPGDEHAFSAACGAVLADRARAAAMRVASRSAAEAFTLERMIGAYEELFDRAAAAAHDRRGRRAWARGASVK
jgi:glycosyltransferase involved in cell wall biosynthesis